MAITRDGLGEEFGFDDPLSSELRSLVGAPLITSAANSSIKAAARLQARKGRRDDGLFLVEGPQAVSEGIAVLTDVYVTPQSAREHVGLLHDANANGARIRTVTPEVMRALSDTVTPQGIVGIAPILQPRLEDLARDALFLVVLDGVSDPGNAGAIIRTADAAGADGVVFLRGSTDPYNPKAVRSTTGSIFHLPIVTGVDPEDIGSLEDAGMQLLCADVHASVPVDQVDLSKRTALVFGGEASGLSSTTLDACSVSVHIPIAAPTRPGYRGHAESLNLAAAAAVMAFSVSRAQSTNPPT